MARLAFDTFPKSATAWLARTLELCFAGSEIVWGGHRSTTFINSPNCMTSVRHPAQAAPSAMCFFGYDDPAAVLDWYCRFMEKTLKYRHRVYASRFENLTSDPMTEMLNYAAKFGLDNPTHVTCKQITDAVRLTHPLHLPAAPTKQRKRAETKVNDCQRLTDAVQLYEALTTN